MKTFFKNRINLFHLLLPLALVVFIINFFFRTQSLLTLQLTATIVIIYVLFSLVYHYKDKSLTLETFLEYILIGSLILVLLAGTVVK